MLLSITADSIVEISKPLIAEYIGEQEEYIQDIHRIFNGIEDVSLLNSLLIQEQECYSEERTLKIAEILENACENSVYSETSNKIKTRSMSITDIRISFNLDSFRRKPALYFYERAVSHKSVKAMERVATILNSGEGDIKRNPARSTRLYECAAESGNIKSLVYLNRDNSFYKSLITNGNYLAGIVLFLRCFDENKIFFAKRHLNRVLKNCNQSEKENIVEYLKGRDRLKYLAVTRYILGETNKLL